MGNSFSFFDNALESAVSAGHYSSGNNRRNNRNTNTSEINTTITNAAITGGKRKSRLKTLKRRR